LEFPGLEYKAHRGPENDGFAANINLVEEGFAGSLDRYVKGNLETMNRLMPPSATNSSTPPASDVVTTGLPARKASTVT
jgi:hypothetical protein